MKLIIDIDKNDYEKLKDGHIAFSILDVMQNGTPIPDNATNGDVIKTIYPKGITAKFATFMRFIDGEHYFNCSEEWWNASYQKGDKNER